jgi:ABC-type Zn2+ transport system substrate-binding protein/surface adhesin
MKNHNFILGGVLVVVFLFSTTTMPHGIWTSSQTANAQMDGGNQTAVIDQLVSNLSQAKESLGGDNSTLTTMQLTAIIGELSDILGKVTTDENAGNLDEHTHVFVHKDHTHTVTHKHPHHADHHHHENWFDRHHIFNPNDCKPGRMC